MSEIMKVDTVQQYNDYFGVETLHPLVSVIEGSKGKPLRFGKKLYNIYAILLKDANCGNLKYGKSIYDYQQGTMLFLAPGQVMGSEDDGQLHQPEGWVVAFHPEFLRGTPLAHIMKDYSYFSYNANEALHLSKQERRTVIECMEKFALSCSILSTSTAVRSSWITSSCCLIIASASTTVSSSPATMSITTC